MLDFYSESSALIHSQKINQFSSKSESAGDCKVILSSLNNDHKRATFNSLPLKEDRKLTSRISLTHIEISHYEVK